MKCKDLLENDSGLVADLAHIHFHFSWIPVAIEELQHRQGIVRAFKILSKLKASISGDKLAVEKFDKLWNKNKGLLKLEDCSRIFNGEKLANPPFTPNVMLLYRHAPIVSVEIERLFSLYTNYLTTKRHNSSNETIESTLVIQWNKDIV